MGLLAWVMLSLAIWHFTIFLPDRFWGGIVGVFLTSLAGGIVVGFIIYGFQVSGFHIPGAKKTDLLVVLYAAPGALLGIAWSYWYGARREDMAHAVRPAPRRRSA